ncbi:hypothetical protein BC829DRAFT_393255 [Chytridium lagenaria]|nr:hypothetical protein BC829DRAFT_393255 [Chytridium lagenaria]
MDFNFFPPLDTLLNSTTALESQQFFNTTTTTTQQQQTFNNANPFDFSDILMMGDTLSNTTSASTSTTPEDDLDRLLAGCADPDLDFLFSDPSVSTTTPQTSPVSENEDFDPLHHLLFLQHRHPPMSTYVALLNATFALINNTQTIITPPTPLTPPTPITPPTPPVALSPPTTPAPTVSSERLTSTDELWLRTMVRQITEVTCPSTGRPKFRCPVDRCNLLAERRYNVRTHLRTHLVKRSRDHRCDCGRTYIRVYELERHCRKTGHGKAL